MKAARLVTAGGVLGLAGLALMPASAGAADKPAPQGKASAATLSIAVSPQALLSTTSGVLSALNAVPGLADALSSDLTIRLDAANAYGALTSEATDVTSGHSDSTPVAIDFKPLNNLLAALKLGLTNLTSTALSSLPDNISSLPEVGALNTQIQALQSGLLKYSSPIDGLLAQVGVNLTGSVHADLNQPNATDQPVSTASVVDTGGTALGSLVHLNLAPFSAHAVNSALAAAHSLSGPQIEADNTTEALSVLPHLGLSSLNVDLAANLDAALSALKAKIDGLLASGQTTLATVDQTVQTVLKSTGLPAAVGGALGQTVQTVTNAAGTVVATAKTTVDTADLSALEAQINKVLGQLDALKKLASPLLNAAIDLNQVVDTSGVTSAATVHPTANGGFEAVATSQFADVHVLPLGSTLAGLLNQKAGISLLEVKGVQSSTQAGFGNGAGDPVGSSKLGEIDVLGTKVLGVDDIANLGLGQEMHQEIAIPGVGSLTLVITRGAPQVTYNTPTHKAVSIAALDVQLRNGGFGSGSRPVISLPGIASVNAPAGITSSPISLLGGSGGTIVEVSAAATSSEVTVSPHDVITPNHGVYGNVQAATVSPAPAHGCSGQACLPNTGMFGTALLAVAGLLGGVAISLRAVPWYVARRRGVA